MKPVRKVASLALVAAAVPAIAAEPTLEEKLEILQQEIDAIRAQLAKQKPQSVTAQTPKAPASQPEQAAQQATAQAQSATAAPAGGGLFGSANTTIGGGAVGDQA